MWSIKKIVGVSSLYRVNIIVLKLNKIKKQKNVLHGKSTPTDQTFSHDYANPLPSFGTPTNKK